MPVGMQAFSGDGGMIQLTYSASLGASPFKLGASFYSLVAYPSDPGSALLLDGNGARDYSIWMLSGQLTLDAGARPLQLGVDYMMNTEDYSPTDPDPFTAFHHDQDTGYVLSVRWGGASRPGDWLAGWYYSRIETFAVNSSYSQDDWMRWGSASETRSSNFVGHEFRFEYALRSYMNLVARLYVVEGIEPRSAAATALEDGNRFRIDLNVKF